MRFQMEEEKKLTVLRVIGVGGAGGNAVNRMVETGFKGVDFVAVNTDLQVLRDSRAFEKVQKAVQKAAAAAKFFREAASSQ